MSSHDPHAWPVDDDDDVHAPTIAMPAFDASACDATVPTNAADLEALLAGDRHAAVERTAPTEPEIVAPQPTFDARMAPAAQLPGAHAVVSRGAAPAPDRAPSDAERYALIARGLTSCLRVAVAAVPALLVTLALGLVCLFVVRSMAAAVVLGGLVVVGLAAVWARGVSTTWRGLPEGSDAHRIANVAHWLTRVGAGCLAMACLLATVAVLGGEADPIVPALVFGAISQLCLPLGHLCFIVSWRRTARWLGDDRGQRRARTLIWLMGAGFVVSTVMNALGGLLTTATDFETARALSMATLLTGVLLLPIALATLVWWFLALVGLRRTVRARAVAHAHAQPTHA